MQRQLAVGTGVTLGATLAMGGAAQAACNCTVNSLADPSEPGHTTLLLARTERNSAYVRRPAEVNSSSAFVPMRR